MVIYNSICNPIMIILWHIIVIVLFVLFIVKINIVNFIMTTLQIIFLLQNMFIALDCNCDNHYII